ncbi:hypothetical protein V1289_009654 [Bradyrhizobium sp. AZCC 2289]
MQSSGVSRRENAKVYLAVIARSVSDEAIHVSASGKMDCFASLAMTILCGYYRPSSPSTSSTNSIVISTGLSPRISFPSAMPPR